LKEAVGMKKIDKKELVSGDKNLYIDIIEPLGYQAKKKNGQFLVEYDKVINKFIKEFNQSPV
jgi:hypothetical protein